MRASGWCVAWLAAAGATPCAQRARVRSTARMQRMLEAKSSSGGAGRGSRRQRDSVDSVSSDVLRQVPPPLTRPRPSPAPAPHPPPPLTRPRPSHAPAPHPRLPGVYACTQASDVAAELITMSPRDALNDSPCMKRLPTAALMACKISIFSCSQHVTRAHSTLRGRSLPAEM